MDPAPQYQESPSSGAKKGVIIGSVALVVIGLIVAGIVIYRSRALGTDGPTSQTPPVTSGNGGTPTDANGAGRQPPRNGLQRTEPDPPAQGGPCGDGICSENESWCARDCGDEEERFLGSVRTANMTATSFSIVWKTDQPSTGEVRYGRTEAVELGTIAVTDAAVAHEIPIEGLSPGGSYYVLIRVTESDGDVREVGPLLYETPGA